ncbi:hypothetical protein KCV87_02655 [Actinosynnema pretiosum subsp. pretiosum]|uniref:PPE family domain-containing protein n=1 Tax=Actinosynnema pretiosum subsp. pretiosum TaxID=103721 RepID=A0AA45R4W7_9PSEU|nr:PE-PGRS family protein [Actinosynnema pretiosum subsp. pretiosum]QUF05043.1 hypothetical protein KCV87_02655 [Actinosynnema pretiosum subsp. pretiosum]
MIDDSFAAAVRELDASSRSAVDALRAALTGSGGGGTGGPPLPERASFEATNWAAYSHEELHRMLRERADIGVVGEIAAEWKRHAEALTGHADAVRGQRGALAEHWRGDVAERAAERIGELAELIGAIGARAGLVGRAAQESADALALAKRTMPPPPGGTPWDVAAGDVAASSGVVFAVGAVAAGGTSMFGAAAMAGAGRALAEEVMRGYEASLHGSDALITPPVRPTTTLVGADRVAVEATGATGAAGSSSPSGCVPAGHAGTTAASAAVGVPWSRLLHADVPSPHPGSGPAPTAPPGSGAAAALRAVINQLLVPPRPVAQPTPPGTPPLPTPPQSTAGAEARTHKRRQPDVATDLFDDDRPATRAVIGDTRWDAAQGRQA